MGFVQNKQYYKVAFVFAVLCLSGFREVLAMRPMEGDHWLKNNDSQLRFQSLKGNVPPTKGNPGTNLPKNCNGRCTMEMDVAGGSDVAHAPAAYEAFPGVVVNFGAAASVSDDSKKQV
ncbi:hypothetical protein ABKV19_022308 [Rosa sericea]